MKCEAAGEVHHLPSRRTSARRAALAKSQGQPHGWGPVPVPVLGSGVTVTERPRAARPAFDCYTTRSTPRHTPRIRWSPFDLVEAALFVVGQLGVERFSRGGRRCGYRRLRLMRRSACDQFAEFPDEEQQHEPELDRPGGTRARRDHHPMGGLGGRAGHHRSRSGAALRGAARGRSNSSLVQVSPVGRRGAPCGADADV
jgi:hypothetical protein